MLTNGTAKITEANGQIIVSFIRSTSFSVGQQIFGNGHRGFNAALRFIRENNLRFVG